MREYLLLCLGSAVILRIFCIPPVFCLAHIVSKMTSNVLMGTLKVKVKVHTLDIAPLRISQFYLHTHTFIRNRNAPYLPLPSQPQLVLIYRPQRDGRLSRPWCEVAQAEIRTRNLPIANPALYHTATSAPKTILTRIDNNDSLRRGRQLRPPVFHEIRN